MKFQSVKPDRWVEAAKQIRSWVNDDSDADLFEKQKLMLEIQSLTMILNEEKKKAKGMMIDHPNLAMNYVDEMTVHGLQRRRRRP